MTADCPDNDTFEAMLLGKVEADVRSRVLQHAETCEECSNTLAALFQDSRMPTESPKKERTGPLGEFASGEALTDQITIEARIGSGGMGTVYRAHHRGLGCAVAVKVLHAKLTSVEAQARLLREARALAQLPTEHVVRIFDAGALASGATYLVMELLPGESLRDYLRRKETLPPSEAIALAQKLCAAMAPAHARGIVHRDLKPDNIFLLPDGGLRVLDFGLSKFAREVGLDDAASLTHSGGFLGTPLYVAPEQIREAQYADARVDVWSIGVIVYEMLTGATPFKRSSVGEVLSAVLTEKAPRLTDVPSGLASLVARCLAPLDERPRDASALAHALEVLSVPRQAGSVRTYVYYAAVGAMVALGIFVLSWKQIGTETPRAPVLNTPVANTATSIAGEATSAPTVLPSAPMPPATATQTSGPRPNHSATSTRLVDGGMSLRDAAKDDARGGLSSAATIGASCSKPGAYLGKEMVCGRDGKVQCDAGTSYCSSVSACVRLNDDEQHCGKCGVSCKKDERCNRGTCESCKNNPFEGMCGGTCVGFAASPNCGGCNVRCGPAELCLMEKWRFQCKGTAP